VAQIGEDLQILVTKNPDSYFLHETPTHNSTICVISLSPAPRLSTCGGEDASSGAGPRGRGERDHAGGA
jgi:hypothetical protein